MLNTQRQMPAVGSEARHSIPQVQVKLQAGIQMLEGPDTGNIGSLLDILLAVDFQVLGGRDIGDITGLPNMLLVRISLGTTLRCLGAPTSAILGFLLYQLLSGFKLHELLAPA